MKLRATVLVCVISGLGAALVSTRADERQVVVIEANGLAQPADILVDAWGVPHIYAKTFRDAFFVQGFNAARDRLFQIDLWRRRGLGRLAEVLGSAYVEQDKAARLFLYRGDMKEEWASYGRDAEMIATAFVQGVNAYIDWLDTAPEMMPIEFKLLGYRPSHWKPADVVRIRSHGLTRNLNSEVARANTVCRTDAMSGLAYDEVRVGLQPSWRATIPQGLDPCLPPNVLRVFRLATQNVTFTKHAVTRNGIPSAGVTASRADASPDGTEGSNNWAIAPSKSATGRPILANDPHRAYSTPSLRYIAHLNAPGINVVGAGEPALPGISIGHNGTIAFGLTIFSIDQEDLYVYELNPSNEREYRYRGGWERMRVVQDAIRVKNAAPVHVDLTFTRHGPVIYADAGRGVAYAVRTGWLEPGMSPYFGSVAYMRTTTFQEFQRTMLRWGAPSENLVYADVNGNIGWVPGGLAPVRPNWDGLMPVPGDGRYEWAGFWPGDRLPSAYNPASGYVTTSNEMNLPPDYPYRERKLGFEWAHDARHARIDEVLRAPPKVSIDDSLRLQNDVTSIPGRRLAALVSGLTASAPLTQAALHLLRGWDGTLGPDSPQAALVEVWRSRHLADAFKYAVLPKAAADAVETVDVGVMLEALERPEGRFGGDQHASSAQTRDRVLLDSLTAAYVELQKLQGPESRRWQWGRLHYSLPEHPLTHAVDGELRTFLQPGPFPVGGSPHTPNASAYRRSDFQVTNGASFRMVVDVGQWDNSRAVNYPGQSGNPASPHYRDLAALWLKGDYFPLLYTREAVEKATKSVIQLRPARR